MGGDDQIHCHNTIVHPMCLLLSTSLQFKTRTKKLNVLIKIMCFVVFLSLFSSNKMKSNNESPLLSNVKCTICHMMLSFERNFSVAKATLEVQMSVRSFVRPSVSPLTKPPNSIKSPHNITTSSHNITTQHHNIIT